MITRQDYLDGKATFEEYYGEIARECGNLYLPVSTEEIREFLKTDKHLNNIPLAWWDAAARAQRTRIAPSVCKRTTGGCSLSDLVCVLKTSARIQANA